MGLHVWTGSLASWFAGCARSIDVQRADVSLCDADVQTEETDRCETPSTDSQPEVECAPESPPPATNGTCGLDFLSLRFVSALAILERCRLFPSDALIENVSWDAYNVLSGACRLTEVVFAPEVNVNEFWFRVSATACLTIAMKQARAECTSSLKRYVKNGSGSALTTVYFCIFTQMGTSHSCEQEPWLLHARINHAEGQILAKLAAHLFRILVLTPAMSVELLCDSLISQTVHGDPTLCCLIRNVAARLDVMVHTRHSKETQLVRRTRLDESNSLVASSLLLIAVEALSIDNKDNVLPRQLIEYCLASSSVVVELALRIVTSVTAGEHPLPKARVLRKPDCVVIRAVDPDTLKRVEVSLRNILRKL